MSIQRLTLLPTADAPTAVSVEQRPRRNFRVVDDQHLPEVVSISRLVQGGRWRTEAMRSYDRPVLIWFTRGQGRLTIAGRSGGYGAHSAIYLPAGTMHGFSATPAVLGSIVYLDRTEADLWPDEPMHLRMREVHRQRELTGLIDAIETEQNHDHDYARFALRHHAGLLAIWFARQVDALAADAQPPAQEEAAYRLAQAFTSLVEKDFRNPIGVQHFAQKLGVTPTHLSRSCRKASGRAALDILTERRQFEACRLLRDTERPIREVAEQAGFGSAAYFTRFFRARTGQSPSEFRNRV